MPSIADLETAFTNTERLVRGVPADRWTAATPCSEWDTRALVDHTVWVMEMITAATKGAPPPHAPTDDLLGADPGAAFARIAADNLAAWKERGFEGTMTLPPGELPAMVAGGINFLDAYVHGWDIAQATGQDARLDDEVCERLLEFSRATVPPDPRGDSFGPVVSVAADAPASARLLGYLGRTP